MTAQRQHAAAEYNALKTAWKRLVDGAGGVDAVAACTRTTVSHASEFGNIRNAERFVPADVVLDIESLVGEPLVTAALAAAQGYQLLPITPREAGNLARVLAELSADVGTLFKDAMTGLSHPALSDTERTTLIRDLDDVARVAAEARCLLQQRAPDPSDRRVPRG